MADPMKDDPSVIKVRGLPYDASAIDLCRFFKDCEIVGGPNGRGDRSKLSNLMSFFFRNLFLPQ